MPLSRPGSRRGYRINVQLVQKREIVYRDGMQAKCQDCCDSEEMMLEVIARSRETGPKVDTRMEGR